MITRTEKDNIAYLALYHAIHGNIEKSLELRSKLKRVPQHENTAARDSFERSSDLYDQY